MNQVKITTYIVYWPIEITVHEQDILDDAVASCDHEKDHPAYLPASQEIDDTNSMRSDSRISQMSGTSRRLSIDDHGNSGSRSQKLKSMTDIYKAKPKRPPRK